MERASVLEYTGKLKIFNFFSASAAVRVNLQLLYTLVKVLVFYQGCECFISVASVLSVFRMFYQCYKCFINLASVLSALQVFYQCCECFIKKETI